VAAGPPASAAKWLPALPAAPACRVRPRPGQRHMGACPPRPATLMWSSSCRNLCGVLFAALFALSAAVGEDSVASHNAAGRRFVVSGRWERAVEELRRAVELDPRNVEAHTYLCRAYLGEGRIEEAIAAGLRAVAAGHTPRGQAYLSLAYSEAGNLSAAQTYAQAAVSLDPGLGVGHAALARVHLARKEYDQAVTAAEKGIATRDRDPDVACILARICRERGNTDQALHWLREAIRYQPISSLAHAQLGEVLLSRGDPQSAAESFARATRLAPEDARLRGEYAEALAAAGDGAGAVTEAQGAVDLAPKSAEAQRALGVALAATEKWEAAAEHLAASLSLGWPNADSYRRLAKCYRRLGRESDTLQAEGEAYAAGGDQDHAIEKFAAVLARQPDSLEAQLRLARAYLAGRRLDEAAGTYRHILDTSGSAGEATAPVLEALVGLGQVACAAKDIQGAVGWYRKALAADPGNLAAWEGLGRAYEQQWLAMSRSVVRVGVRLTSPKEPFTQDLDLPEGPVRVEGEITWVQHGVGSGFVVNSRGDIVTNAHVVEILRPQDWDYELAVGLRRQPGAVVRDFRAAEVLAYDVDLDLAVVRVGGGEDLPAPLALAGDPPPSPGDWVFELGHPLGGDYGTNGGSVLRVGTGSIEYNADFKVAMSGGPLVNERGAVVGVVCMGSPTKQGGLQRQLAVSAKILKSFLAAHNIPYVDAGEQAEGESGKR
jgi:tetratricopeptide (TPR) repeat protein